MRWYGPVGSVLSRISNDMLRRALNIEVVGRRERTTEDDLEKAGRRRNVNNGIAEGRCH